MSVKKAKTRPVVDRPAVRKLTSTAPDRTKNHKLTKLSSLASALSRAQALDPLLDEVLKTVTEMFETEIAQIMLFDPSAGDLRVRASRGVPPEYVAGVEHLKPNEGIAGRVYVSGKPLVVRDAAHDPRVTRTIVKALNIHALACVPLIAAGQTIGVLVTASYDQDREITDDIELLEFIGLQLGMVIQNVRLLDENIYARKLWESTFNAIREGISVHTQGTEMVKANKALARILDVPLDQLVGNRCCLVMLGRNHPLPDCADTRAVDGPPCQATEVIERPNGQILRVTVDPLVNEDGHPCGSVHVVSDITDQVLLERRIARAEQLALIGELAAGLAHEVKNPLAGIKGALEIIIEAMPDADGHRPVLNHVLNETMRVNRIISDLLDYARPHAATHTRTDLNQLIDHAIMTARLQAANAGVGIEYKPVPDLPAVIVDPDEVQKVILNLLLNAMQAVNAQGHVFVAVAQNPNDQTIILRVSDNGEGIPPENLDKIFRPFFTTKKRGTGLGLATCQRIVTAYGGTIRVDSQIGEGSTFTVTLPIISKNPSLTSRILTVHPPVPTEV